MRVLHVLVLTAIGAAAAVPALAARPVAPEDLFKLTLLDNVAISPDGAHAIVGSSTLDGSKNTYDRTIDLIDVATGALVPNVTGKKGDGDYAWMPDGKSFVFVRALPKHKPQLYRYTLATRKAVALTHIKQGVSGPVVSHDGKHIALSVNDPDPVDAAYVNFAKAGFKPSAAQKKTDIRKIDTLFFETNGQGYTYADHPHIWIVNADGGHPKQLTFGKWSEGFDAWSPDDRTIAFNSLQYDSVDSGPNDVYVVPAGGGQPQKMVSTEVGDYGLFFSTDGSRFYSFRAGVKDSAEQPALVSSKLDGSDVREIVAKNRISWGDSLLADMKEGGGLCAAPLPGGHRALLNVERARVCQPAHDRLERRHARASHAAEGRSVVLLGLARRQNGRISL